MPIDPSVLDEIEKLTADQLLAELREAKASGSKLDPRTLKLAMEIIERAHGKSKAFQPKEEPVLLRKRFTAEPTTEATEQEEEDDSQPVVLPDCFKTKDMRDKLRKVPFLTDNDRAILNSFAEQDGAEMLTNTNEENNTDG